MSEQTETKTEEIRKEDPTVKADPMATVVSDLLKTKDTLLVQKQKEIADLEKRLEELEKTKNANPVDHGIETESKPKVTDEHDVGDKANAENKVAPKPSDSQASIVAPAVKEPGKDNSGLSMENKSDSEKKEEEKEVEKTEEKPEEKKEEKKEEIKKSNSIYKKVETVRPLIKSREVGETPTAYQMLKATEQGFGVTKNADQALTIMYEKMNKGEFGDGLPSGGAYY